MSEKWDLHQKRLENILLDRRIRMEHQMRRILERKRFMERSPLNRSHSMNTLVNDGNNQPYMTKSPFIYRQDTDRSPHNRSNQSDLLNYHSNSPYYRSSRPERDFSSPSSSYLSFNRNHDLSRGPSTPVFSHERSHPIKTPDHLGYPSHHNKGGNNLPNHNHRNSPSLYSNDPLLQHHSDRNLSNPPGPGNQPSSTPFSQSDQPPSSAPVVGQNSELFQRLSQMEQELNRIREFQEQLTNDEKGWTDSIKPSPSESRDQGSPPQRHTSPKSTSPQPDPKKKDATEELVDEILDEESEKKKLQEKFIDKLLQKEDEETGESDADDEGDEEEEYMAFLNFRRSLKKKRFQQRSRELKKKKKKKKTRHKKKKKKIVTPKKKKEEKSESESESQSSSTKSSSKSASESSESSSSSSEEEEETERKKEIRKKRRKNQSSNNSNKSKSKSNSRDLKKKNSSPRKRNEKSRNIKIKKVQSISSQTPHPPMCYNRHIQVKPPEKIFFNQKVQTKKIIKKEIPKPKPKKMDTQSIQTDHVEFLNLDELESSDDERKRKKSGKGFSGLFKKRKMSTKSPPAKKENISTGIQTVIEANPMKVQTPKKWMEVKKKKTSTESTMTITPDVVSYPVQTDPIEPPTVQTDEKDIQCLLLTEPENKSISPNSRPSTPLTPMYSGTDISDSDRNRDFDDYDHDTVPFTMTEDDEDSEIASASDYSSKQNRVRRQSHLIELRNEEEDDDVINEDDESEKDEPEAEENEEEEGEQEEEEEEDKKVEKSSESEEEEEEIDKESEKSETEESQSEKEEETKPEKTTSESEEEEEEIETKKIETPPPSKEESESESEEEEEEEDKIKKKKKEKKKKEKKKKKKKKKKKSELEKYLASRELPNFRTKSIGHLKLKKSVLLFHYDRPRDVVDEKTRVLRKSYRVECHNSSDIKHFFALCTKNQYIKPSKILSNIMTTEKEILKVLESGEYFKRNNSRGKVGERWFFYNNENGYLGWAANKEQYEKKNKASSKKKKDKNNKGRSIRFQQVKCIRYFELPNIVIRKYGVKKDFENRPLYVISMEAVKLSGSSSSSKKKNSKKKQKSKQYFLELVHEKRDVMNRWFCALCFLMLKVNRGKIKL